MGIHQAAILLGGKGERLKPFTDNTPKPMIKACGKPFLEYLVVFLKGNGIRKLLFLVGYLGDKIKAYFGDGSKWGVEIDYSFEEKFMGTGGALQLAKNKLENEFFLLFGDSYLPIDYKKIAYQYSRSKKMAMLAIYDNKEDTKVPFNLAVGKSKKIITYYNKKEANFHGLNYCDAGVVVVSKEVLNLIGEKTPISFEEAIYPALIAKGELGYYIAENRFYDIGTFERLRDFKKYIVGVAKK